MKFIDEAGWNRTVQNNQDAYGSGVIRFTERWANMMEQEIEKGSKLRDIAERTSHEADTDGITGFMLARSSAAGIITNTITTAMVW